MQNGCQIELLEVEELLPGGSATASIFLIFPDYNHGRLYPGFEFVICEGARPIGKGTILEVKNSLLAKAE